MSNSREYSVNIKNDSGIAAECSSARKDLNKAISEANKLATTLPGSKALPGGQTAPVVPAAPDIGRVFHRPQEKTAAVAMPTDSEDYPTFSIDAASSEEDYPETIIPAQGVNFIDTNISGDPISLPDPVSFNPALTTIPDGYPIMPAVLCTVLTNRYGESWASWEPETLRKTLAEDDIFPATQDDVVRETAMDCAFSLQLLYSHTGVWDFWTMFEKVCKAFNGVKVQMNVVQPPHPNEMVAAVITIKQLRADLKDELFGEQLAKYIAACCFRNGFVVAPRELSQCQPFLEQLSGTDEYSKLAETLWSKEPTFYKMSEKDFVHIIETLPAAETDTGVQTVRSLMVVQYVREYVNKTLKQLQA